MLLPVTEAPLGFIGFLSLHFSFFQLVQDALYFLCWNLEGVIIEGLLGHELSGFQTDLDQHLFIVVVYDLYYLVIRKEVDGEQFFQVDFPQVRVGG